MFYCYDDNRLGMDATTLYYYRYFITTNCYYQCYQQMKREFVIK